MALPTKNPGWSPCKPATYSCGTHPYNRAMTQQNANPWVAGPLEPAKVDPGCARSRCGGAPPGGVLPSALLRSGQHRARRRRRAAGLRPCSLAAPSLVAGRRFRSTSPRPADRSGRRNAVQRPVPGAGGVGSRSSHGSARRFIRRRQPHDALPQGWGARCRLALFPEPRPVLPGAARGRGFPARIRDPGDRTRAPAIARSRARTGQGADLHLRTVAAGR